MHENPKTSFFQNFTSKQLLVANIVLAIIYFLAIAFWFPKSNTWLFSILIASQVFYTWQLLTYIYTIWNTEHDPIKDPEFTPGVDVYITVAGEPVEIVEETALAAKAMDYPNFEIYLLNDGYVAGKENWRDIEHLARKLGIHCITRTEAGGAKAGNINHAMRRTDNPYIVIFDADHVPHTDFLQETMGHFVDNNLAFVQSPQYYKNHEENFITGGSWEQQSLFFGPICKGKNRLNSVTMCGTNMVIRRTALDEVGGMCDTNIAEDFVTGLFIHENGWKSLYVPKVLAEGLAPEDFLSYYKQQFRWARGSLEVLFKYNPFFRSGLSWAQKIQYAASASFYISGLFVLLNALIPLAYFFTGAVPFSISSMTLTLIFLPYIFLAIYNLQQSCNFAYTFRALSFSIGKWPIHIKAIIAVLSNQKSAFAITSKTKLEGNFVNLVIPHLVYIGLVIIGIGVALGREGLTPSLITNTSWAAFYVAIFVPFIKAALPQSDKVRVPALRMAPAVKIHPKHLSI